MLVWCQFVVGCSKIISLWVRAFFYVLVSLIGFFLEIAGMCSSRNSNSCMGVFGPRHL